MYLFAFFNKSAKRYMKDRRVEKHTYDLWKSRRNGKKKGVVFFVSSAGEYEQAKPIIDRLEKAGSIDVQVFIYSESGMEYIRVRNELISIHKAPHDTLSNWRKIFTVLRPDVCVVVRHELWPGFLASSYLYSSAILIDATESLGLKNKWLARNLKSRILRFFSKIYVVGESEADFFCDILFQERANIKIVGDTKYDRVKERDLLNTKETDSIRSKLEEIFPSYKRLVVGSGWHRDIEVSLDAMRCLKSDDNIKKWQLVIAPHDISGDMISWIESTIIKRGLDVCLFSKISDCSSSSFKKDLPPVLIVDTMGILAELYELGTLAFVGGALHHKVHNVLEPAIKGLFLAYGNLYKNSREAEILAEEGLVQIITNHNEFKTWWLKYINIGQTERDDRLLSKVNALCGAADKITSDISLFH